MIKIKTPEEYWQWWLDRDRAGMKSEDAFMFFED